MKGLMKHQDTLVYPAFTAVKLREAVYELYRCSEHCTVPVRTRWQRNETLVNNKPMCDGYVGQYRALPV